MKTILTRHLFLAVCLIFINCSSDDEILSPRPVIPDSTDSQDIPVEPLPDDTALIIPGLPKIIKKYENDKLYYWAQYFYSADGNILKIKYRHPASGSEIFTEIYKYDSDGKMIALERGDTYYFYWEQDRIVAAETYNAVWYGKIKISYEYNTRGQIIQKIENYTDISAFTNNKTIYSYFEDGNLKTIQYYWQEDKNTAYQYYAVRSFEGYNGNINLFLETEFEIIPGQNAQLQFPAHMKSENFNDPASIISENYEYKYDNEGRVIEKKFNNKRVVYQYY